MMVKRDPALEFTAAVEDAFEFLVSDAGFTYCGQVGRETDPRDAELRLRFLSSTRTVEVVLSMTGGLGVEVGALAEPVDSHGCPAVHPRSIVHFEQFLLARHAATLAAPFPEMKPHKVFMTMYSQQVFKYMKVVSTKMPAAVGVMATRFKAYGLELLASDLEKLFRETGKIGLDPIVAPRGSKPRN